MNSHKKLQLSKETLRSLTSDVPSYRLEDVQGGNASQDTCVTCIQCWTTGLVDATWLDTDCWLTR